MALQRFTRRAAEAAQGTGEAKAAYGPMALSSAGRVGDGLVLQLAEPGICKWLADQAIEAGAPVRSSHRARGRAPSPRRCRWWHC
jgi:hypothetical protein